MDIIYREVKSKNELESLFRLRHKIYSEDQDLRSMISSDLDFEINNFDLNAIHFGAFDAEKPIAYIRIICDSKTIFTAWVEELISENKIILNAINEIFPLQIYYPNKVWITDFLKGFKESKVGEVGKLAIAKDYRNAGEVLDNLISSLIAYLKEVQNFKAAFGLCTKKLARYYRKFGFKIAENSESFCYKDLPEAVIVLFEK